jgi:Ca2+-transporting ATPase
MNDLSLAAAAPLGLSEVEAAVRLRTDGYNELPRADRRTPLRIVGEVLREPMLALLLAAGAVYLALGDLHEALILLAFASASIVITVVQEARTERVLQALRDLTSPRALVIRDGEKRRIAGREVVRGDLMILAEGDRVPADAVLLQGHDLQADESLLTGESVPVRKAPRATAAIPAGPPGGDDHPHVFSGSLIVRGSGTAEVTATGPRSEIGKIGQTLSGLDTEPPRLQTQTRRVVRVFGLVGGIVSVLAVVLYGVLRGGWLNAVLAGIALGMSMLPEEFPVVLTVFMAMGAWRISRERVLTRRAAAIETLGSATVLCTDKTGTLTENRMSIAELWLANGTELQLTRRDNELSTAFRNLVNHGVLASAPEPFDPMEKAFHELRHRWSDTDGLERAVRLARTYGLRPELLAVTQAWTSDRGDGVIAAAKGAPEAIGRLCRLSPAEEQRLGRVVDGMAARGLRILGVASARHPGGGLPDTPHGFQFELLGLVGLADPLRASVREAVAECRSAGIRVVMITGDYPATAAAIAHDAGLDATTICTGDDLMRTSDRELERDVTATTVFARIMPEQKLRIVNALKARGEIVAMTGDGVNDAPSLKAAHIGVAMGGRGTDVAREASSIVLLDDDFGSIVKAVRLGRRIYDNLLKAMAFILAVHVPIAGLALLPLVVGLPILLTPIHIAFLEMVIDPVCTLVFEAETEEDDVMRRRPRPPDAPLLSGRLVLWGVLQGLLALALVASIYVIANVRGMPEDEARALAFFSLVTAIVALIFTNRSFGTSIASALLRPNGALKFVIAGVTSTLALTMLWPAARALFRFGPLHADDLSVAVAAGVVMLIGLEALKPLLREGVSR